MNYSTGTNAPSLSFLYIDKFEASKIYQSSGTAVSDSQKNNFMDSIITMPALPWIFMPIIQKSYSMDVYNDETIAAMEEAERMLADPNTKKYNSFSDILAEVKAEVRDEIPD